MEPTENTPNSDADFAAAFGELNPAEGTPVAKPVVAATPAAEPVNTIVEADPTGTAPAAAAAGAPALAAEGTPNAEPATAPATPDPATPPVAAAPPAAAPAPDPFALIAALQAEVAALKNAPAPEAPETPAPLAPLYSTDEEAVLAKYREDWPEIARGEALTRRQEFVQLASYIFSQVEARVAPIEATAVSSQGHTQYSQIVSLVPDYDAVRDPTLAWIQTQPARYRDAYQGIADEGTPEEVAHLIGMFKVATDYVPPAAPAAPSPTAAAPAAAPVAPATGVPTVSAAAAAAAKALKPVVSGRSEPATASDPNDFDAAWSDFSKTTT